MTSNYKLTKLEFEKIQAKPNELFVKTKKGKKGFCDKYYIFKGGLLLAELLQLNKNKIQYRGFCLSPVPFYCVEHDNHQFGIGESIVREFSNIKECLEHICMNYNQIINTIYLDIPRFDK